MKIIRKAIRVKIGGKHVTKHSMVMAMAIFLFNVFAQIGNLFVPLKNRILQCL